MPAMAHAWMVWFLAAAAVPVIIHLIYGFRRKRVPTGAIWMIRQVLERNARRLRLRDILLLLLRILAVVLAVLAFARPLGWGLSGAGGDFLVLMDDSYLARTRTGPDLNAFQTLRARLLEAVPGRGRYHLLTASGRFEGEYEDIRGLRVALRGMEPSWSGWDPAAVLRRAPADRAFSGAFVAAVRPLIDETAARSLRVQSASPPRVVRVPEAAGNAALAGVEPAASRPGASSPPGRAEALAFLCSSTFEQPVRGVLALKSGGRIRLSKPVEVPPGGSGLHLELAGLFGPWYIARAELEVPDSLPEDNTFHVVLRVRPLPEVFVVSDEHRRPVFLSPDYYVFRAVEAGGRFKVRRSESQAFEPPETDAVVVSISPDVLSAERIEGLLSEGTGVAVFLAGRPGVFEGLEEAPPPDGDAGVEVPAGGPLEGFSAEALAAPGWAALPLEAGAGWEVWARVGGRPVVLSRKDRPLVVVNSYGERSRADLVRHRVFVPLMHRIIEHLSRAAGGRTELREARVGQVLRAPGEAEVTGPRGARFELKEGEELRLEEPGVYRIATAPSEGREKVEFVGVNLDVSTPSSGGMVPLTAAFRSASEQASSARSGIDRSGRSGPWRYIVMGLLALLVMEMILGALPLIRGR